MMGGSYLADPVVFLIDTLTSLYVFALMLRFLLQWLEADFYNPISQFLVKLTHPPLKPLRRIIPSMGRIDTASLVLMLVVQALGDLGVSLLQGVRVSPGGLVAVAAVQLLELLYYIFFYSILISAILSWVSPRGYNPVISLLYSLTEPVLRVFQRILPPMGGVDLSPLAALIALEFARKAVMPYLQQLIAMLN